MKSLLCALLLALTALADPIHDVARGGSVEKVFHGNSEVVKVLLARGADRNTKDKEGKTAADLARSRSKSEVLQLLNP